ncbi:hypothetical protein Lepto7375DRAFT_4933 [Leptolyngbya sp. PCC 7375]|nr:hypothetical protein Lepto7375DRAFT_4933 [Leptolyngbya sp. PCC 7375]
MVFRTLLNSVPSSALPNCLGVFNFEVLILVMFHFGAFRENTELEIAELLTFWRVSCEQSGWSLD